MKNSIAPFDMRVDDWIDERMDFWKSTEGALRKLEENYRYFGDWPLALAAYNAGFGAVSRIVRETGIRDYWVLSERKLLKSETIQYVPKFLAAAHILSNPRRHGLEPRWEKDPRWTRVPVKGMVDLELLAAASGLEAAGLKGANQELRFGITPPEEGYFLKVPAAGAGALAGALEGREAPLLRYYLHTLRSGDTLSGLALHYGVSTAQILSANPGTEERRLRIGARLRIPALREPGPERKTEGPEDRRPFEGSYRVRRGDTLWSIARAHGVSVEALAEANSMAVNGVLREGSVLKTPILKTREGNSD
jgi:membrane-bound lytic murein transglycosylase D